MESIEQVAEPPVSQEVIEEVVSTIDEPKAEEKKQEVAPETKEQEEKLQKGVQRRIDRAVRQKYEAEARAKMLEERLAALEARQPEPARQKSADEPKIDDFDNLDEYVAAKAAYIADQRINATLTEREKRELAKTQEVEQSKAAETWHAKVSAITAELPDFHDVVESSDVEMTDAMKYAILDSDVGPKLAYYLAMNPDEAESIAKMPPIAVVRAMTRIEDKITAGALTPKKTTDAPAPITPVGTKAKVEKAPTEMSDKEFAAWRRNQIKKR